MSEEDHWDDEQVTALEKLRKKARKLIFLAENDYIKSFARFVADQGQEWNFQLWFHPPASNITYCYKLAVAQQDMQGNHSDFATAVQM